MNPTHQRMLALSFQEGMGFVRLNRLRAIVERAGSDAWEECLGRPKADALRVAPELDRTMAGALSCVTDNHLDYAERLLTRVAASDVQVIARTDGDYPKSLASALGEGAPPLLFVLGNPDLLDQACLGIVGSRDATRRGLRAAGVCAQAAVDLGAAVASGAARGVDTAAHEAALAAGGRTVAFVPEGILEASLPESFRQALDESAACAVSPFRPDAPWSTYQAVTRNSFIASVSRVVCVVEPFREGGSALTGRVALQQGKRVLVGWRENAHPPDEVRASLANAEALYEETGGVDGSAIRTAWETPGGAAHGQAELFD